MHDVSCLRSKRQPMQFNSCCSSSSRPAALRYFAFSHPAFDAAATTTIKNSPSSSSNPHSRHPPPPFWIVDGGGGGVDGSGGFQSGPRSRAGNISLLSPRGFFHSFFLQSASKRLFPLLLQQQQDRWTDSQKRGDFSYSNNRPGWERQGEREITCFHAVVVVATWSWRWEQLPFLQKDCHLRDVAKLNLKRTCTDFLCVLCCRKIKKH